MNENIDVEIKEKINNKLAKPPMYEIIILNDDYTPQDFVVNLLMKLFSFSFEKAYEKMLLIHNTGHAVCGIYSYEIASHKNAEIIKIAKLNDHPLKSYIRKKNN